MKCNLPYYTSENIYEMNHHISFLLQVALYIDSCDSCTAWTPRRSLSKLAVCSVSKKSPGTNPMCEMRRSWEGKDKRYSELGERKQDEHERRERPANIVVRDFPVTFGRQFNCRGIFGLLVEFPVSCSSKLLTTLSTGHQNYTSPTRQSTRGYNLLLKKWVHDVYSSN